MSHSCYHCGLPVPDGVDLPVNIGGERREMCCPGCQAVAQAIVDNGLTDYYRSRDNLPESPREALPAILDQLSLYDHAEFQKSFVRAPAEGECEVSLLLEGITCAACIWLNEKHLAQQPGVLAVSINYATRRARVRWDSRRIKLSGILAAVAAIGYRAYPYDAAKNEQIAGKERRDAIWRLWVAGFGMMQVMMYAIPVYLAGEGDMSPEIESLMRWASLLLTLPVVFYSAAPFFRHAWRDVKLRRLGMDVPVALGIGTAFAASVWATLAQAGEVYFDSVAMFVFFLLGGRYLEMTARQKAVSVTEALAKLQPAFAWRLPAEGAEAEKVMVADLVVGDYVQVRPGETVPADGLVINGESRVDEALLTGESRPVKKIPGSRVIGGSVNHESPLQVQVEAIGQATRLSAIVALMERAAAEKPGLVEVADRVAGVFVWGVLLVAAATVLGWAQVDPQRALWTTVSVLVVTCPCALSLATPIALTVAAGALARDGLLVTRGYAIERLARATHFVFDKTGTLTEGRMQFEEVLPIGEADKAACLAIAAALESASEHPIAAALRGAHTAVGTLPAAEGLRSVTGAGMEGGWGGKRYRIGRPDFVADLAGSAMPEALRQWGEAGGTVVALASEGAWHALFRLSDRVRPEAAALMDSLRRTGRHLVLLTGDAPAEAARVARQVGIAEVCAGASPEQKHAVVAKLQAEGAVVAMLGDGVNDAPVLAQAQVSVAMGGGSQLARTQADFVLLSENLDHLHVGVERARFALRVIRQNLWWSFAYNVIALPLAIGGYVTPWLAGVGMSASSLLVVLNSLRIQRTRFD